MLQRLLFVLTCRCTVLLLLQYLELEQRVEVLNARFAVSRTGTHVDSRSALDLCLGFLARHRGSAARADLVGQWQARARVGAV